VDLRFSWIEVGPRRGQHRGKAWVEYSTRAEAEAAKRALDGKDGRLVARFESEWLVFRRGEDAVFDVDAEARRAAGEEDFEERSAGRTVREYRTAEEQAAESRATIELARKREAERRRLRFVHLDAKIARLRQFLEDHAQDEEFKGWRPDEPP
jgi:hypothetical protein